VQSEPDFDFDLMEQDNEAHLLAQMADLQKKLKAREQLKVKKQSSSKK
jgi:hypothetical protein